MVQFYKIIDYLEAAQKHVRALDIPDSLKNDPDFQYFLGRVEGTFEVLSAKVQSLLDQEREEINSRWTEQMQREHADRTKRMNATRAKNKALKEAAAKDSGAKQ